MASCQIPGPLIPARKSDRPQPLANNQAELIAYIADFRVLALVILCCIPVILIMNNPHRKPA